MSFSLVEREYMHTQNHYVVNKILIFEILFTLFIVWGVWIKFLGQSYDNKFYPLLLTTFIYFVLKKLTTFNHITSVDVNKGLMFFYNTEKFGI